MRLIGATTLSSTHAALLNVTAIALVSLMVVPLALFLGSCWIDRRLAAARRRGGLGPHGARAATA